MPIRTIYVKTNLHLLPGSEKFAEFAAGTGAGESDADAAHEKHGPAAEINAEDDEESEQKEKKENPIEHQPVQPLASPPGEPATNPPDETPHTPDLSAYQLDPVAVFEQVGTGTRGGGFRFADYHRLARLQFIEPHSADLIYMLEQKFSVADRFGRVVRQQRSPEA
ncbi:hypothetical protein MPH_09570 [Macrophomina phaseolina MS6]|uniref:Uncharacterized protein n=1 Tax=Macrophomina phaseolina (strain MS6) TaxID=1126212 RepID=K2RF94_MACPH|nr:hypothetical protein MPH_09570 [Macrophomina phaseolina MS6]